MARTRQKRKAKRREEQLKATRRDATAKQQAANPAEQAAIQTAEALEAGDELEEIARGEAPSAEAPAQEAPSEAPEERDGAPSRRERQRKEPRAERKPAQPRKRGRVMTFFVQVWAELRRVQWPDRNQVTQATSVVVIFCFLAGAFLALFDFVFGELITRIL